MFATMLGLIKYNDSQGEQHLIEAQQMTDHFILSDRPTDRTDRRLREDI